MRKLLMIAAIAAVAVTAGSALGATDQQTAMKTCSNKWTSMTAPERGTAKRTEFMSKCLKAGGPAAAAPAMAMKPAATGSMAMTAKPATGSMAKASAGGQAKCKDGKTVTYTHRAGTCSGHGGVATWM
jgi:hypothetical protein